MTRETPPPPPPQLLRAALHLLPSFLLSWRVQGREEELLPRSFRITRLLAFYLLLRIANFPNFVAIVVVLGFLSSPELEQVSLITPASRVFLTL